MLRHSGVHYTLQLFNVSVNLAQHNFFLTCSCIHFKQLFWTFHPSSIIHKNRLLLCILQSVYFIKDDLAARMPLCHLHVILCLFDLCCARFSSNFLGLFVDVLHFNETWPCFNNIITLYVRRATSFLVTVVSFGFLPWFCPVFNCCLLFHLNC